MAYFALELTYAKLLHNFKAFIFSLARLYFILKNENTTPKRFNYFFPILALRNFCQWNVIQQINNVA